MPFGSADQARRLRPDMAFGADLIAGFPTETEAMFATPCTSSTTAGSPFSMSSRTRRAPARRPRACRKLQDPASRSGRHGCGARGARRWQLPAVASGPGGRGAGGAPRLGRTASFAEVEIARAGRRRRRACDRPRHSVRRLPLAGRARYPQVCPVTDKSEKRGGSSGVQALRATGAAALEQVDEPV